MVGGEDLLITVGAGLGFHGCNAGIVDQAVDAIGLLLNLRGGRPNRLEAGQITLHDRKLRALHLCLDLGLHPLARLRVTHQHQHPVTGACQFARGDRADAMGGAGNDRGGCVHVMGRRCASVVSVRQMRAHHDTAIRAD